MYSSHSVRSGVALDELFRAGDHVCQFFRSGDELGEVLVPYFKAGLDRNELCLWVTGEPYGKDRAASEMRAAVPDFDRRAAAGQIHILDTDEWYTKQATLSPVEKVQSWLLQKEQAIRMGYAGLRASGNTSFLDERAWDEFLIYEQAVDEAFKGQPITGLCSYCFDRCSAKGVVDIVHCHRLGLAKRHGQWGLVEVRKHGGGLVDVQENGHDTFVASAWPERELRRVIEDQLAVFIGAYPDRITLQGGRVQLGGPQAASLGIFLFELATNAAKHGALSSTHGKLAVHWRVVANGSRQLQIRWIETGIGGLTIPAKMGLGTRLMASAVQNCVRVFSRAAMECTFELSLADNSGDPR